MAARKKAVVDDVDAFLNEDTEETEAEEEDLLSPDAEASRNVVDDDFDEDTLSINLDDIDENATSFKALPAGVYECFIEQLELKKSQAGNPMVAARYKISEGEYEGRLFFDHYVLNNEIGLSRLKNMLMALEFSGGEGNFNIKEFIDSGQAIGVPCRVKVTISFNKDRGEKQNQVREIMPSADQDPFFG